MNLFSIFLSAALIDNIVLMQFLALCPFIGMSSDAGKSIGMGMAVMFVTVMATIVTYPIFHFILVPMELEFLQILVFILVIAALVQLVEFFLKKNVPGLYASMGIFLPLITTNCAILAVTFNNISKGFNLIESVVYAVGVASGFLLALLLLAGLRSRMKAAPIPAFLKGTPALFVTTSLLAVAFMGFSGLSFIK
ncbi:MAG: electron transport complex subunit RsxA [Spirochaetes bacterium GWD1_61_31]|nr:MAG: electron transport complex subunit RsxA [Spirochaetes bacterium GWB1_60_80]OHD34305.1 MAG: electron transport complex subunit RsxA [Spirochaetes bacterium GWC1_61_12]OHD40234.1 MAG: electron transport complex subunit RsxA [Spirochaetes bacterium GWD1_61_31]OHD45719.1 MAG: electron transport complex subunit RsxA [Spirochaetes bacterium GWE1_60_18]OHD59880.1 MAG: electron transport complex subunit RsxA [Spirochaetes bacterium GWF1_60_12]HBO41977.1 electron transport complex subunit RsxA 